MRLWNTPLDLQQPHRQPAWEQELWFYNSLLCENTANIAACYLQKLAKFSQEMSTFKINFKVTQKHLILAKFILTTAAQ